MEAQQYFMNGYSCSESIIKEAIDKGFCSKELLPVSAAFSGGIGSGCLCGAVSASVMVIGYLFGKNNKFDNPSIARNLSKEFMEKFKETHKCTCCKILSRDFEMHTPERKQHCSNFVEFCSKTLYDIINIKDEQYKL